MIIKSGPLINLHTHTQLCQHATGVVDDYCHVAIQHGLQVLGFSDHTPLPDDRWPSERMTMAELSLYDQLIEKARVKYDELVVLKGMECEYFPEYHSFFEDELLGNLKFDYLIGAVHYFPHNGGWFSIFDDVMKGSVLDSYCRHFIDMLESGLFKLIAHPDIFGYTYPDWDKNCEACARDILAATAELDVALEINGKGYSKPKLITRKGSRYRYPWFKFWEIAAEYDITYSANSDAHKPADVNANIDKSLKLADYYKLKPALFNFA